MKKCARDFHIDVFWKEVTILIARVGESWVETHQPLQNLKGKIIMKKAHTVLLVIRTMSVWKPIATYS